MAPRRKPTKPMPLMALWETADAESKAAKAAEKAESPLLDTGPRTYPGGHVQTAEYAEGEKLGILPACPESKTVAPGDAAKGHIQGEAGEPEWEHQAPFTSPLVSGDKATRQPSPAPVLDLDSNGSTGTLDGAPLAENLDSAIAEQAPPAFHPGFTGDPSAHRLDPPVEWWRDPWLFLQAWTGPIVGTRPVVYAELDAIRLQLPVKPGDVIRAPLCGRRFEIRSDSIEFTTTEGERHRLWDRAESERVRLANKWSFNT